MAIRRIANIGLPTKVPIKTDKSDTVIGGPRIVGPGARHPGVVAPALPRVQIGVSRGRDNFIDLVFDHWIPGARGRFQAVPSAVGATSIQGEYWQQAQGRDGEFWMFDLGRIGMVELAGLVRNFSKGAGTATMWGSRADWADPIRRHQRRTPLTWVIESRVAVG